MSERQPLAIAAGDRDLRQRDYLLRAAQAISEPLDLREVLARVIQTAVAMTGGHAGAIALRQSDGEVRVVASYQLDVRFETHLEPYLDQTEPEKAIDDARPPSGSEASVTGEDGDAEFVSLDASHPNSKDSSKPAPLARIDHDRPTRVTVHPVAEAGETPDGAQQVLNLPLELAGETLGRIFIFRSDGAAAFTPVDSDLLQTFADQAAVAIQNADTHMRLAARERRLASIVDHSPAGVLLLGPSGRVISNNAAAERLLGRAVDSLRGESAESLLILGDGRGSSQQLELGSEAGPTSMQGHLRLPDDKRGAWVQVTATTLPDPRRPKAGWVVDIVDLSGYKEAEDAKRAFLAGLSHELKTPLSLIRGYAETMRYPQVREDDALHAEAVDVILDETTHLTQLVDQLLTAARLEADALELDRHLVDLQSELERLVVGFRKAYPEHGWTLEISGELEPIHADPTRLRELFANLLSNAAKYTPVGSEVSIRAAADSGGLRVDVTDQGEGISETDQTKVFNRFFRAAERGEGAGLGLYMARAFAEAHGGRIDLASKPGQGSTFSVWLPLAAPPTPTT